MATLFWSPKGATVTVGSTAAGQAVKASLTVRRSVTEHKEFNPTTCKTEVAGSVITDVEGELTLEMSSAADLANIALALMGTVASNVITIGDAAIADHSISIVVKNSAASCATYTYAFARCRVADDQEHVFGVPHDEGGQVNQTIKLRVLLASGETELGTITRSA